ncbi:TPA: hypothetical protein ACH3X1_012472 [Trebouxia sp. C0004]
MAQNEEIVPSGQALKQAATWLGITDPAKLLDDDPAAAAFQPRPEGLGLGAKFLAHHKAAHLTMPLEKRFGKRLQRASARGDSDAEFPPQKKGRPTGKYQGSCCPKAESQLKCCLSMHLHCVVQVINALSAQLLHVTVGCLLLNHTHSRQCAWLYSSIWHVADTCNCRD